MRVHLLDGTYELFRHHFALPSHVTAEGLEIAAVRGAIGSVLHLLEDGVSHLGVATDAEVESFRNRMWPGYKSSEGMAPELLRQFPLLDEGLTLLGVKVWAMVELEADDALASAAAVAADDEAVEQVLILTPDKDLAQCVRGRRVVQFDRRKRELVDEDGVTARYGVPPASIPDLLALVGDTADGYPGLPGWGAKSAAAVLARYPHIEDIPEFPGKWDVGVRGAMRLCATLREHRELALLFRDLATLTVDRSLLGSVDELAWKGPLDGFESFCRRIDAPRLVERAAALGGEARTGPA